MPGISMEGSLLRCLDGAMTNCLFSHGIPAVTGELVVRMHHPVQAGTSDGVRGMDGAVACRRSIS